MAGVSINRIPLYSIVLPALGLLTWLLVGKTQSGLLALVLFAVLLGNESYPQVFAPFGGFADDCPVVDGRVALPDAPGIGFERKADLWAVMKKLAQGVYS